MNSSNNETPDLLGPIFPAYHSHLGRFSAVMPGVPEEGQQLLNTPIGPVQAFTFSVRSHDGASIVMFADFPAEVIRNNSIDQMLNGACLGMVMNVSGMIHSTKSITQNGFPGREVEYEFPTPGGAVKGMGRARAYLVKNRFYQVFVIGTEERVRSEESGRFLESFQFEASAQPSVTAQPHPSGPPRSSGTRFPH